MKSSRQSSTARKKPREYQSNLAVLKSNKTNASKARSGDNVHEEEEKKENSLMDLDSMHQRRESSAFTFSPPPKEFSQSKAFTKKRTNENEEIIEF